MPNIIISVIVPVYNVKNYLKKCIDSIISQTFKNIEVILVDDGSSDRSGELCDYYQKIDSRIIVIHKNNEGVSKARITGFNASSGQYIAFIDADDIITNNYLEKMFSVMESGGYDMVTCQYYLYNFNNKIEKDSRSLVGIFQKQDIRNLISTKLLYDRNEGRAGFPFYLPTKLIKREFVEDSLQHGVGISNGEDMPITFSILLKIEKMCIIPDYLYYYVQHPNQATQLKNPSLWLNYLKCWRKLISLDKDHLLEYQLPDRIWFRLSSVIDDILSKEHTYKGFTRRFKEIHEAKDIMHYLYQKKTNNKLKKQMLMIINYKLYGLYYFYHKLKNPSKAQA